MKILPLTEKGLVFLIFVGFAFGCIVTGHPKAAETFGWCSVAILFLWDQF